MKTNSWDVFFQNGSGFQGDLYHKRGGLNFSGLLSGLMRHVVPIARKVGKTVGKQALVTGANIAGDVISGRNIGASAEEHGKAAALGLLNKGLKKVSKKPKRHQQVLKKKKKQRGGSLGSAQYNRKRSKVTRIKGKSKRDIFG